MATTSFVGLAGGQKELNNAFPWKRKKKVVIPALQVKANILFLCKQKPLLLTVLLLCVHYVLRPRFISLHFAPTLFLSEGGDSNGKRGEEDACFVPRVIYCHCIVNGLLLLHTPLPSLPFFSPPLSPPTRPSLPPPPLLPRPPSSTYARTHAHTLPARGLSMYRSRYVLQNFAVLGAVKGPR